MTEPLTPEAIETLAAGYVCGDLDRAEVLAFEQLLADDPILVAAVDQLQMTLDQVLYSLNSIEPPAHLESAILSVATAAPIAHSPMAQRRRSHFPWQTIMGSMAALLILYLGADNYRLRQEHQMAQDINALLQQSQTQLFSLTAVNTSYTSSATGSFVVNLGQRQGILSVQNLGTPPPGRIYRLWAIADGERIPCGTLTTNAQGQVLDKFWMPADFYDTGISGLFVTLESSETSRYPTGTIVMQSNPI
jgi:anti-sigma-K factor RskA